MIIILIILAISAYFISGIATATYIGHTWMTGEQSIDCFTILFAFALWPVCLMFLLGWYIGRYFVAFGEAEKK